MSIPIRQDHDIVAIGIGSNIGNKKQYIVQALRLINDHKDCEILSVSRLYQTPPWGKKDQDLFLNAAALIKTQIMPNEFLDILLSIENNLNRKRDQLWGARTIDLDILLFGNLECITDRLTIPHPYITKRGFVIVPLADIAPHIVINGLFVKEWLFRIDTSNINVINDNYDWWLNFD
ncbi:2-amino-4-hydroxy-6-hydroxymethyldihydropteridine diphosphokinase [Candidatus Liberibacter americanus]|uniref:2-amino-4-hydroxy-6- hydroxymethyldihydropteridine diphosphokinase n=1 Tax=Candidatus Liberibacter americanus TaxID=309868 RepID=UPI0002C60EF8|nr:2-amino-4-hydroxy-6-hydroxymethyldihydropteridine diphosphokinase [Candidatus Liberibacter americanus]EMS35839.1 2-amino-4-hydroxy-6-hydroxymethyldihydropteridine pyrophosphokinase [Candidatus Liberibacter americanus PW_SP]